MKPNSTLQSAFGRTRSAIASPATLQIGARVSNGGASAREEATGNKVGGRKRQKHGVATVTPAGSEAATTPLREGAGDAGTAKLDGKGTARKRGKGAATAVAAAAQQPETGMKGGVSDGMTHTAPATPPPPKRRRGDDEFEQQMAMAVRLQDHFSTV